MPVRYPEAFGLRDNPFGPRLQWRTVPPNLTNALEKRPLLVHRDPALDPLYCREISYLKSACESLEITVEAGGYSLDPATREPLTRGTTSYFVAIEGDRGAGKTTLASRMLRLMIERTPAGQPAWDVRELLLDSGNQTANEQGDLLKALEASIVAAKAPYVCLLVDDLLADAFPFTTQLYDRLLNSCVLFLVLTSYDPKMTATIDKSLHNVERFQVLPLSADDAIAYVSARYELFRIAPVNGMPVAPLFPFDEGDIRTAVQIRTIRGSATTGPVNLRLLASILEAALSRRLLELAKQKPAFDLQALGAPELKKLLIKLAQSYSSVVQP